MWSLPPNSIPYTHFTNAKIVDNRKGFKCLNMRTLKWLSVAFCAAIVILPLMTVMALDAGGLPIDGNATVLVQTLQSQPAFGNFTAIQLPLTNAEPSSMLRGLEHDEEGSGTQANIENTFNKLRVNAKAKLADIRVKQKERHQHATRKIYRKKQMQQQQQQHQQAPQKQKKKVLHADKTIRLLEHTSAGMHGHEQPIYGTWRTKARRPQQLDAVAAAAKAMQQPSTGAPTPPPLHVVVAAVAAHAPSSTPSSARPAAAVELATATRTGRILATTTLLHMSDGHKQNVNVNANANANSHVNGLANGYGHGHGHSLGNGNINGNGNGNDSHHNSISDDYRHHVYEPLPPQRAASVLNVPTRNDQMLPRPPRLVSRQPSLLVRRQYLETPLNNYIPRDEQKPKPFHFPYDGPLPEEFKRPDGERPDVNNIQDILQQLHLNGGTHKVPQLVMMPTGLHIAGSFKNLKSSGIMNFFRGKRNNNKAKQMQLTFPMPLPMQMLGAVHPPTPMYAALAPAPYQQRITMDQFYAFKPRSPNEVNLLALQQQQQNLKANRSKSKKQKNAIANTNLLLQHTNQLPFATVVGFNATQPHSNLKHVPFNVNLDIFPVLPPNKPFYAAAATPYEQMKMPLSSARPMPPLRNPYGEFYGHAMAPSAAALIYDAPHAYKPMKFPGAAVTQMALPQASNMKITFPDQTSSYYQQQQQQQQQQQLQLQKQKSFYHPSDQQQQAQQQQHMRPASVAAIDCNYPPYGSAAVSSSSAPKANQLMVHLNVFPKQQRPQTAALGSSSTNPFYGSAASVNRQTIYEEGSQHNYSPAETVYMAKSSAAEAAASAATVPSTTSQPQQQQQQPLKITARSDNLALMPFTEPSFEPFVVSKDYMEPQQAQTITLISNKLDNASVMPPYSETRHNYDYDVEPHGDTFRFPVEDLIQFQVNDAL